MSTELHGIDLITQRFQPLRRGLIVSPGTVGARQSLFHELREHVVQRRVDVGGLRGHPVE